MKMKNISVLFVLLSLFILICPDAGAINKHSGAYDTYNYSFENGSELASAAAYVPVRVINGVSMGTGAFSTLSDIFVDEDDKRIYLADSGNNRIVSSDLEFKDIRIYKGVVAESGETDMFSAPKGVFAASDGYIYVADTGKKRIVKMDKDGKKSEIFGKPNSPQFEEGVDYKPQKVAVNDQGDISVICEGIYEGIVSLDQTGGFQGYLGMNLVKPSLWDLFWRMVSTRKQLESMEAFYPVTFMNMDIDENNFIFATSQNEGSGSAAVLQKLNPGGNDVFRNTSGLPLIGDLGNTYVGRSVGFSLLNDIATLDGGIVACTDQKRSKIFLYNEDGEMLFAFGNNGGQYGDLTTPSGIDNNGYTLYVSDSGSNQITIYKLTAYGKCILDGITGYKSGNYQESRASFVEAFRYNTNSEIAYLGIGKTQLRSGEYKQALANFRLASNRIYYSKALKEYRREVFDANFIWIFAVTVLVILILILKKPLRKQICHAREEHGGGAVPIAIPKKPSGKYALKVDRILKSLDFANFCVFHPFKGFYELKYEKCGTMAGAIIILALFTVVSMFRSTLTGFLFNPVSVENMNPLWEGVKACMPVLLFVIANWCITTLMNGEGSMNDIFMAACYALTPVIYGQVILIAVSNFIVSEESVLYYVAYTVLYIWMICLMLVGNMSAHNFTMSRTVMSALVTVLAMAVIIFILFLFFNLGFEVVGFVTDLYKEALFRV